MGDEWFCFLSLFPPFFNFQVAESVSVKSWPRWSSSCSSLISFTDSSFVCLRAPHHPAQKARWGLQGIPNLSTCALFCVTGNPTQRYSYCSPNSSNISCTLKTRPTIPRITRSTNARSSITWPPSHHHPSPQPGKEIHLFSGTWIYNHALALNNPVLSREFFTRQSPKSLFSRENG